MRMVIKDLHEQTLQHLMSKEMFFVTRRINRANKLEKGFWFHGNDYKYINVSFWLGHDSDRKVNNIGLGFDFDRKKEVYLYLTGRRDEKKAKFLRKVAKRIGAKKSNSHNLWIKEYKKGINSIDEFLNCIDEFISVEKPIIDDLLENEVDAPINFISSELFSKQLLKINEFRTKKLKIVPNLSNVRTDGNLKFRRKGQDKIKIKDVVRKTNSSSKKIAQEHKRLQNCLKSQLLQLYPDCMVKFEIDYIDVLVETKREILLVEVKINSSVINCFKEALGQLLFYYSKFKMVCNKKVKLIIAGPSIPNDESKEYIRFIRGTLKVDIDYLKIEC